jgi:hypothetical protein
MLDTQQGPHGPAKHRQNQIIVLRRYSLEQARQDARHDVRRHLRGISSAAPVTPRFLDKNGNGKLTLKCATVPVARRRAVERSMEVRKAREPSRVLPEAGDQRTWPSLRPTMDA